MNVKGYFFDSQRGKLARSGRSGNRRLEPEQRDNFGWVTSPLCFLTTIRELACGLKPPSGRLMDAKTSKSPRQSAMLLFPKEFLLPFLNRFSPFIKKLSADPPPAEILNVFKRANPIYTGKIYAKFKFRKKNLHQDIRLTLGWFYTGF